MLSFIFSAVHIVGYEFTVHTTTEGKGHVELCAVIFKPGTGGAPLPFELSFTTEDGSAGQLVIHCISHTQALPIELLLNVKNGESLV